MEDRWLHEHMSGKLITIEIIWVGGVVAIIVFYFIITRKLHNKRAEEQSAKMTTETVKELNSGKKYLYQRVNRSRVG